MRIQSTSEISESILQKFNASVRDRDPNFNADSQQVNVFTGSTLAFAPDLRAMQLLLISVAKQSTPFTADSKLDNPTIGTLEEFGSIYLDRPPFAASRAEYSVEVNGSGGTLHKGTIFNNQYTQEEYTADSDYIITTGTRVRVTASRAGERARLKIGDRLYLNQAIPDVDTSGVVVVEEKPPVDAEDIEEYRSKIIRRAKIIARGGSIGDYVNYAIEIDGVRNAYPYNGGLLRDARVYIRADEAVNVDGIPPQSLLDDVAANFVLKANITAPETQVLAVLRRKYTVDITGLSDNSKKTLIENEINAFFSTKEPFIDAVDRDIDIGKNVIIATLLYTRIINAISPAIITKLVLKAENVTNNGFFATKDISALTNLYGSSAPSNGSFIIKKDNSTEYTITVDGRRASSLADYISILRDATIADGIRVSLFEDENKHRIKFESATTGATSKIELKPPTSGTDLTSATYYDITNQDAINKVGGVSNFVDVESEILPEGTIPYLGGITYV